MKQMVFACADTLGNAPLTRKDRILIEMNQVVPEARLIKLIQTHNSQVKGTPGVPSDGHMAGASDAELS